jgi:hypothetical protein
MADRVTTTVKVARGGSSLRPVAPTISLGFGIGARFRSPTGGAALSIPIRMAGTSSRPGLWPPCDHLRTDAPTAVISCGVSSFGHRSCAVFAVSLSRVAGCLQDDAPVRRASRLRTTSDGARFVLFDTALTDRDRSRQNFSSALRAPLTLRLFPGATSFQHQPTREETT